MTLAALEALVLDEARCARLRLQHEIRRGPTGPHLLLWSDLAWMEGLGGRRVFGHDDLRRREASIAVLALHSRAPRISYGTNIGRTEDLWPPTRCPEAILGALVFQAIAQTVPTPRRLREARRRLRAAGVRLSDIRRRPTFSRRTP